MHLIYSEAWITWSGFESCKTKFGSNAGNRHETHRHSYLRSKIYFFLR